MHTKGPKQKLAQLGTCASLSTLVMNFSTAYSGPQDATLLTRTYTPVG